ncbi:MAG: FAD:protein FMN transferase [Marinagarivorans sp.]|nr:FAD:protein FMN transferase [Marinagarivorans sp.]
MGTPCQIQLVAESLNLAQTLACPAIQTIHALEAEYSRYLPSSLLSRINHSAGLSTPVALTPEAQTLLAYAASVYEQSDGLFDVTSGVLRRAWNFKPDFKSSILPTAQQLQAVKQFMGWPKVGWQGEASILLPRGFEIDFGGFVKEYAADAALSVLKNTGVHEALVDLGGDVAVMGARWPIAIKNPLCSQEKILSVVLEAGGLATSGNYERFFMHDGHRYSHILNPKTGWPVVTPASVTVVADNCLLAGTVTTVAMLKGEQACLVWLESVGLPFCCVFNDGRVVSTL